MSIDNDTLIERLLGSRLSIESTEPYLDEDPATNPILWVSSKIVRLNNGSRVKGRVEEGNLLEKWG